jgi:hypothetical protein
VPGDSGGPAVLRERREYFPRAQVAYLHHEPEVGADRDQRFRGVQGDLDLAL